MPCHKRCTYFFVILFSILALVALVVEIVFPWMIKNGGGCRGIVYSCDSCISIKQIMELDKCTITKDKNTDSLYLISLATSATAGGIIALMTVLAIVFSCSLCCRGSTWSKHVSRFIVAYIVLDFVALVCNAAGVGLWVKLKDGSKNETFDNSFYVGWAATGIMLILFVMLIVLRKVGGKDSDEKIREESAAPQVLFRSLYSLTPSTVFRDRPSH